MSHVAWYRPALLMSPHKHFLVLGAAHMSLTANGLLSGTHDWCSPCQYSITCSGVSAPEMARSLFQLASMASILGASAATYHANLTMSQHRHVCVHRTATGIKHGVCLMGLQACVTQMEGT